VELCRYVIKQLKLMLAGVGPSVDDVVQHRILVQIEPIRNRAQTVRPASVLLRKPFLIIIFCRKFF